MKKYIAIDTENDTTNDKIIMSNGENDVSGTLRTTNKNNEMKDIKEIFIQKADLESLDPINIDSGEFTLDDVAEKYNSLIQALKTGLSVVVAMFCLGTFAASNDGKAQLGKIKSNQYVVTNEVDGVFTSWNSNTFSPWKTTIDGWKSGTESWIGDMNTWKGDINGWKADVTDWMGSINGWKTDVSSWMGDINGWKSDVTSWMDTMNGWKSGVDDWKADVNDWRSSVDGWKEGIDDWKTNKNFSIDGKETITFEVSNPRTDFKFKTNETDYVTFGDYLTWASRETDPVFGNFLNKSSNITVGRYTRSVAGLLYSGLAIGAGYSNRYDPTNPGDCFGPGYYTYDFNGPTIAGNAATAYGDGAQARDQVSVAIGNRAMASGLHTTNGVVRTIELSRYSIVTKKQGSTIVDVQTNEMSNIDYEFQPAMWESWPDGNGTFSKTESSTTRDEQGFDITTDIYTENISGLRDPRYASPEEYDMYDIYFEPGQPNTHYASATYGVAMGYRALAGAYHTLALGHYARAYRPHAMAIGPSTHIKSEGAVGLAYYSTIETNSPFSLAIGSRVKIDPGMTNAIVIGVPKINFSRRFQEGYKESKNPHIYMSNPKAMKPNSINFVFNGKGLDDVFVDNIPMTDRIANDISIVGNIKTDSSREYIKAEIDEIVGIKPDEKPIVFFSRDGGVKIYTQKYLDSLDDELVYSNETSIGDVSEVEINGKKLNEIIRAIAENSGNQGFDEYHTTVTNAAMEARAAVGRANNMQDIKNALNNFFDSIK